MNLNSYEAWNSALAARFLQGHRGAPLYLYTDAGVLEEVSSTVGVPEDQAVDNFLSVVAATLTWREPFLRWEQQSALPVPEGAVPRYLAVLCFLVMAGVEQQRPNFNYYPELNRMLGRDWDGAPKGFERHVPLLFTRFNEWLAGPGQEHGLPTARPPKHWPYVGWPLSQALVRPPDRVLLRSLFAAAGLTAGVPRTSSWLKARILPRLRGMADSRARSRLLFLEEHDSESFDHVLQREYDGWDGGERALGGPSHLFLRLCYDETYGDWWFACPAVEGTAGARFRVGDSTGTVPQFKGLEASPHQLWSLLGKGPVGVIDHGPNLVSPAAAERWLSVDTRVGGWAEVGRRDPDRDQLVLVSPDRANELESKGARAITTPALGLVLLEVAAGLDLGPTTGGPATAELSTTALTLHGGFVLRIRPLTYLWSDSGLPDVSGHGGWVMPDGTVVPGDGAARLHPLLPGPGEYLLGGDDRTTKVRFLSRLREPGGELPPDWVDDLEMSERMRVPWTSGPIWFLSSDGEASHMEPRDAAGWHSDLGLPTAAVDVEGRLGLCAFAPHFVVSRFMGQPWVTPVPERLRRVNPEEENRPIDRQGGRELVAALLSNGRPDDVCSSTAWRRALASFMRQVHR